MKNSLLRRITKKIADWLTPLGPNYSHGKWEIKNLLLRKTGIIISENGVAINSGFQCIDGHEEDIKIECYTTIGRNVKFWNFNKVKIGKFCTIAAGVTITNGWHDKINYKPYSGIISIGSGCWIGTNATIIGNVKVGTNSIIGAGALVNKDIPPNSIVAGTPAKIISKRKIPDKVWHFGNIYFCPRKFIVFEELSDG
jgi:acetyltransferase-like isoleucine patch superfamily enzyme